MSLPTRPRFAALAPALLALSTLSLGSVGCGKKTEPSSPATASKSPALDIYTLFPAAAVGLGKLDVNALFHSGKTGETLGHLIASYSPLGPESGFSIEANVDRLTCATYQLQTADVLCVAEGRFDQTKLDRAVDELEAHAKADPALAGKAPDVVRTPYAGRTLITAANVGFTLLDSTHMLAGTENAMRRALDRLRDGNTPARELPKLLEQRVVSAKADLAVAVSLEGVPLGRISFGFVKVRLLQGLREVYGTGSFKKRFVDPAPEAKPTENDRGKRMESETDVTLITHLVYADEGRAAASKEEAADLLGFAKVGASLGISPRLGRQEVWAEGNETVVALGFRDDNLASWLEKAPEKLGLPAPGRSSGAKGPVPGADPPK